MLSYYRVLGVSQFADRDEIRQAYQSVTRRLRRQRRDAGWHARLAEARRAFEALTEAHSSGRHPSGGGSRRDQRSPTHRGPLPAGPRHRRDTEAGLAAREIPLGFPSMSPLVPRVVHAFLGPAAGDRPTHSAEISVTSRQARDGAHVPVTLRVRPTCPVCGGRGETWAEPCGVCQGTGSGVMSHQVQLSIPPGVRDGARLRFCIRAPFSADANVELRVAVQ